MPPPKVFKLRGGTSAQWAAIDPVLADREPGFDSTSNKIKVGDGVRKWSELPFVGGPGLEAVGMSGPVTNEMLLHINSSEPHPAYDDGPSLLLLYQNAKV